MTLYDEYCYNLMESAIKAGAEGKGLTKEECIAYMNLMAGARGVEQYIESHSRLGPSIKEIVDRYTKRKNQEESEVIEDGEEMGD